MKLEHAFSILSRKSTENYISEPLSVSIHSHTTLFVVLKSPSLIFSPPKALMLLIGAVPTLSKNANIENKYYN